MLGDAHSAWNQTILPYPTNNFSYDVTQVDADRY